MPSMTLVTTLLGTLVCVVGVFISLRGRHRSRGAPPTDHRSYFVGVALILVGAGIIWLPEFLKML